MHVWGVYSKIFMYYVVKNGNDRERKKENLLSLKFNIECCNSVP